MCGRNCAIMPRQPRKTSFFKALTMKPSRGARFFQMAVIALLVSTAAQTATATITVVESKTHTVLLNVINAAGTDISDAPAGAAAIAPPPGWPFPPADGSKPSPIVGVYQDPDGTARGFTAVNPFTPNKGELPTALGNSGFNWVQPYDVNSSGQLVGAVRSNGGGTRPLYAATATGRGNVAAVGNLQSPSQYVGSAATAVNNSSTPLIVGYYQRVGQQEQAFYTLWPGTGLTAPPSIAIPNAYSSRALSVNTPVGGAPTLVAGFYRPQTPQGTPGNPRGFVYSVVDPKDPSKNSVKDIGRVVIPTIEPFDQAHYVSINAKGEVAATQPVPTDSSTSYQAFLLDSTKETLNRIPIKPIGRFEDSFAAGISEDGWVVGAMRDIDPQPNESKDSGFVWINGQTIDLSVYATKDGWTGITWALDVYTDPVTALGTQTGYIVGVGKWNGQQRSFVMELTVQAIPEPQTYVMLGLGLLAIATLRMRRFRRS